ncbi:MAG: amidohydrolase [Candidatus Dormibacteria bacterium]
MGHDRELLVTGGPIWSGWPELPRPEALLVRDGRVVAMGTRLEVESQLGGPHQSLDLRGRALLPGFHDAHCHPIGGGLQQRNCDLDGAPTAADCQRRVAAYLARHPATDWVVGSGWSMETFPRGTPPHQLLDPVTGAHPAFLTNRDGHSAWVNQVALERAGINRNTPDPPHGRIERDPQGRPQGTLHEAAMDLVGRLVPAPSTEELTAALLQAQAHLHQLGIVGWQDAAVDPAGEAAYSLAASRGALTARVRLALWWQRERGLDQVPELVARRAQLRQHGLDAGTVKLMLDGVMETYTAALLEPYQNPPATAHPEGASGHLFLEPEEARAAVVELDRQRFQVHFHAIGDRAVRVALDAVADARVTHADGDGPWPRHHIAHLQLIDPADLGRFANLAVVANIQPFWACHEPQMDELTIPYLGAGRSRRQYPFRSLLDRGATLAAGSDWPVSTADPLQEIAVAVRRVTPALARGGAPALAPFLPEQRISLQEAFDAFTRGSAFVSQLEREGGCLAPGRWADLVVLAEDPFRLEPDQLPAARVELTMVGGTIVYDRGTV